MIRFAFALVLLCSSSPGWSVDDCSGLGPGGFFNGEECVCAPGYVYNPSTAYCDWVPPSSESTDVLLSQILVQLQDMQTSAAFAQAEVSHRTMFFLGEMNIFKAWCALSLFALTWIGVWVIRR